jgi:REP element-mobilizing transposase RayT
MRKPRLHVPGGCYHVTLRGNHQQDIFFCDDDCRLLAYYVAVARQQVGARIHAYCWMTNHIHVLIQVGEIPLGAFMQRIATRYARAVQSRVPTTGHLFQNRYHALLVDVDRYFLALLRYIHLNPVRGGMVTNPTDHPWSSHRAYLGLADEPWLTTDFGLGLFGDDVARARQRYREFVSRAGSVVGDQLPRCPLHGEPRVLGDHEFLRRMISTASRATAVGSLDDIAQAVCSEFAVSLAELRSKSRRRTLSRARGQFTARALASGVATLSEVARHLNRSSSALARAADRHR